MNRAEAADRLLEAVHLTRQASGKLQHGNHSDRYMLRQLDGAINKLRKVAAYLKVSGAESLDDIKGL